MSDKLLEDILVVDFSQFLAGPLATLKLADFGARVIKIERPVAGDLCRNLYLSDVDINDTNTLFHAINRNKESYSADLKKADDLQKVKNLIKKADILVQNFRPSVMKRIGLDYDEVKKLNPNIIYASITGYGANKEWEKLPGQDLLAQAKSGLMWASGNNEDPPIPFGIAIADQQAGNALVQGILAALVRRGTSGVGALVETSLLEALIDFQFEVLTTHINDPRKIIQKRSNISNAHSYLAAPYGVYETQDGYVAIAMMDIDLFGKTIGCKALEHMTNKEEWFIKRDEIKEILAAFLIEKPTSFWIDIFVKHDIWASEVYDWDMLFASKGFQDLSCFQNLKLHDGKTIKTTRSPLVIDKDLIISETCAPNIGEHNKQIESQFNL